LFQRISFPTGSPPGSRLSTMSMPITQAGDPVGVYQRLMENF